MNGRRGWEKVRVCEQEADRGVDQQVAKEQRAQSSKIHSSPEFSAVQFNIRDQFRAK